jgi:hypothetical protein
MARDDDLEFEELIDLDEDVFGVFSELLTAEDPGEVAVRTFSIGAY